MARSTWGSIRKKSDGIYEIRWPKTDNRRASKTIRGTRKDAEQELARIRVIFDGAPDKTTDLTLGQAWELYYLPTTGDLRPSTISGYKGYYKSSIEPKFGHRKLSTITHRQIQDHFLTLTRGAAQHALVLMRTMFKLFMDEGLISKNPFVKSVSLPTASAYTVNDDVYSLATMNEIFETIRGEVFEIAFICAAFGGMRLGEACSFTPDEIDFTRTPSGLIAVFNIKRTVQRVGDRVEVHDWAKTEKSMREVVITEPYSFRVYELVQDAIRRGDTWMLDDGFGDPINPVALTKRYKDWCAKSPFKYIPFKNLRKSFSTALREAGVDMEMTSKMLGHSQPTTTYKHYDSPSINSKTNAALALKNLGDENPLSSPNSKNAGKVILFNPQVIDGTNNQ